MLELESRSNLPIEELLRVLWVEKGLTREEMRKELDVNHITLINWLKKAGIYSRRLEFQ